MAWDLLNRKFQDYFGCVLNGVKTRTYAGTGRCDEAAHIWSELKAEGKQIGAVHFRKAVYKCKNITIMSLRRLSGRDSNVILKSPVQFQLSFIMFSKSEAEVTEKNRGIVVI